MTVDLDPLRAGLPSGLVALDFDGTLAPISPRPGDARPLTGAGQLLRDVRATGATLAIVTGRTVASLLRVSGFGAIPGIVIYGSGPARKSSRSAFPAWTRARRSASCWTAPAGRAQSPSGPASPCPGPRA